ncbi:hypothetical protein DB346_13520 [Verrucomicrobia bacterium LW23]|nr:hypothetical protein DB346_13520 [Verrucomicrobia bacterium LW23]
MPRSNLLSYLYICVLGALLIGPLAASALAQQPQPVAPASPTPVQKAKIEEAYKLLDSNDKQAIAMMDQLLAADPAFELAYYVRALAKGQQGDYQGALADINKCSALNEEGSRSLRVRALLNMDAGNYSDAVRDFQKYLGITVGEGYDIHGGQYSGTGIEILYYAIALAREGKDDTRTLNTMMMAFHQLPDDDDKLYAAYYMWYLHARNGRHEQIKPNLKALVDTGAHALAKSKGAETKGKPDKKDLRIGRYLVDEISKDEYLSQVEAAPADTLARALCEAYFYIGAREMIAGKRDSARTYFQKALATRQQKAVERLLSAAALQQMKTEDEAKAKKPEPATKSP